MTLRPLRDRPAPRYPARPLARLIGRLRRLGAVAATSAALSVTACYGATPIEEPGDGGPVVTDGGGDGGLVLPDGGGDGGVVSPDGGDAAPPTRRIEWCEPDYRLSGEQAVPHLDFACGAAMPADAPTYVGPQYMLESQLCGDEAAWARVVVEEGLEGAVTFPFGTESAVARVWAPDGTLAVELGPDHPCASFAIEPGTWALEVRPASADVPDDAWFTMALGELYDED